MMKKIKWMKILDVWMFIWTQFIDQLPVGLLAQLVERCTGIVEVMGSNPYGPEFFQVLFTTTRFSSVLSCEDPLISSFHRSANMWIFIYLKSSISNHIYSTVGKIMWKGSLFVHCFIVPIDSTKGIKMLYVFVDIKLDATHFVNTVRHNFEAGKSLALLSTIQFVTTLQVCIKWLHWWDSIEIMFIVGTVLLTEYIGWEFVDT